MKDSEGPRIVAPEEHVHLGKTLTIDVWLKNLIASTHDGRARNSTALEAATTMDCTTDRRLFHSGYAHTRRRSNIRWNRHFHPAVQRPLPRGRRVQNTRMAPGPSIPGNLCARVRRDHPVEDGPRNAQSRSAPAPNCPRPPCGHLLPDSGRLGHVTHRQFFAQTAQLPGFQRRSLRSL